MDTENTSDYRTQDLSGLYPIRRIDIDQIRPGRHQMRRHFDPEAIAGLAESIRQSGVIQPVVVRAHESGYELLAGERRWRAAQQAGLHSVPAVVRNDVSDDEALILGLVENLQRESLNAMETAQGLKVLSDQMQLTHEQAAQRIGKSRVYVTNFLRLLNLCPQVQQLLDQGQLSMGHARALAGIHKAQQQRWAKDCIHGQWSVRQLELRLRKPRAPSAKVGAQSDWERLRKALEDHLNTKVNLEGNASGKGSLSLHFHNFDELDGLLERLGFDQEL
jgi:ParB family chromosome partitioning protein